VSGKRYKKRPLISSSSPDTPENGAITRVQTAYHFSGPLPPPEALARYNDVVPNGAERIFAMVERQSAHRESLEAKVVSRNASSQTLGSTYAFILSLVAIIGGIWLIHDGKSVTGLITILANLATLAGVFIYARRKQTSERVNKSTALAERSRD